MRWLALTVVALLAGCSGPGEPEPGAEVQAAAAEADMLAGQLTAVDAQAEVRFTVGEGHERLAVALVLATNLPSTVLSFEVAGPDGSSSGSDTRPFLYAFPGVAPVVAFGEPVPGEWTVSVRLDSGAVAEFELAWCADAASAPGPQDNRACQRDYAA